MQEIDRESSQGHVNQEQLRHMPYTEACVKEALRLYPPATALARQLTQDMQIMGHHVPKGTGIFVSPTCSCSPSGKNSTPSDPQKHTVFPCWEGTGSCLSLVTPDMQIICVPKRIGASL